VQPHAGGTRKSARFLVSRLQIGSLIFVGVRRLPVRCSDSPETSGTRVHERFAFSDVGVRQLEPFALDALCGDIEPSFKHQRVFDCILQVLFRSPSTAQWSKLIHVRGETESVPTRRPSRGIASPPCAADRAAPAPRSPPVPRIHARAATPRAPSTLPRPPGRLLELAGRSILFRSRGLEPAVDSLTSPTAAPPPTVSCFPSP
jgi:hypothetical protein